MPIGTILPYVGDLNKIPHDWALCDGSNGTPDLRGRFLEGWGWDDFNTHNLGEYIAPGLPNIWGNISAHKMWEDVYSSSGALYTSGSLYNQSGHDHGAHGEEINNIHFNATRCSMIYGKSNTVQPRSYVVYYIMRIK